MRVERARRTSRSLQDDGGRQGCSALVLAFARWLSGLSRKVDIEQLGIRGGTPPIRESPNSQKPNLSAPNHGEGITERDAGCRFAPPFAIDTHIA